MSAKNETPAGYICKGAWVLGSACGECARCLESLPEFLAEDGMPARRARAIIAADRALRPVAVAGDATMPVAAEIRNKTQELGTWVHWVAQRFSGDKLVKQADALAALAAKDAQYQSVVNGRSDLRHALRGAHAALNAMTVERDAAIAARDSVAKLVDSLNAQLAASRAPAAVDAATQAEREQCAKVCDKWANYYRSDDDGPDGRNYIGASDDERDGVESKRSAGAKVCADAIRAGGCFIPRQ